MITCSVQNCVNCEEGKCLAEQTIINSDGVCLTREESQAEAATYRRYYEWLCANCGKPMGKLTGIYCGKCREGKK
ncbi:MAG: hypothetical protein PHT33_06880 [bacterium]|nr:hypothetical protein [bacterium]